MAGFGQSGDDDELMSGINITPLVDVVLVLLIVFMITAPMIYESTIKVDLPSAKSSEGLKKENLLSFTINRDGKVFLNDVEKNWLEIDADLQKLSTEQKQQIALISADQKTEHGTVVKLMDTLRSNGLTKFALDVDSKSLPR